MSCPQRGAGGGATLNSNHSVVESELITTTESAFRTSRLFKLALRLEQGNMMLPSLDIPLKRLVAVSTQRGD